MRHFAISLLLLLCISPIFAQKKVRELLKTGYEQYHLGHLEAAKELSKQILFENPDSYDGIGFKGVVDVAMGTGQNALPDLNYAIDNGVKHPDVYASRGFLMQLEKKFDKAEKDYTKAIALDGTAEKYVTLRGLLLLNMDKPDIALQDFNKVVSLKPNDPNSYYLRGFAHFYANEFDLAIKDATHSLELNSTKPEQSELILSKSFHALGQIETAETHLNKALEHNAAFIEAWNFMGELKVDMEDTAAAMKAFETAMNSDSTDQVAFGQLGICYYGLGQTDTALALLTKAIQLGGPMTKEFRADRAKMRFELGQYNETIADLSTLIAFSQGNAEWYLIRGQAFMRKGQYDSGFRDFQTALKTAPDDNKLAYVIAVEFSQIGDFRSSKVILLQLIEKGDTRPFIHTSLGEIAFQEREFEKAIAYCDHAIANNSPDSMVALSTRAHAKFELGRKAEASKDLDGLLALKVTHPEVLSNLGYLLTELERYADALPILDQSIAINPNLPYAYNNRGFAKYKLGDYEGAIVDFNKSIELKNDYKYWPPYNRANALKALKRYDEALEDFNLAIAYKADYAAAYNDRGETYELMGDRKRAIQDFEKALELEPENEAAKANVERMKN